MSNIGWIYIRFYISKHFLLFCKFNGYQKVWAEGLGAIVVLHSENSRPVCLEPHNIWEKILHFFDCSHWLNMGHYLCAHCLKPLFHMDNHMYQVSVSYTYKLFQDKQCHCETFLNKAFKFVGFLVLDWIFQTMWVKCKPRTNWEFFLYPKLSEEQRYCPTLWFNRAYYFI